MTQTKDPKAGVITKPEITQQPCSCMKGMVNCGSCGGSGMRRCGTCAGSGRVKSFDQLTVRFHTPRQAEVVDSTEVPDDTFLTLKGDVLIDEHGKRIESARAFTPGVDDCAAKMLRDSHRVNPDQIRILAQHLRVERIPVTDIKYTYAGVDHKLWICGKEQLVHAPNAPWQRNRFMWMMIGIGAGVAAVIGLIVFLMTRP
jgi:hypothetical protein